MSADYSPQQVYLDYLVNRGVAITTDWESTVDSIVATVNWDEPESAIDYHHSAVLALIEAEQSPDLETRRLYLDHALQSLDAAVGTQEPSLALAQWAIVQTMLGNSDAAAQVAFNELVLASQVAFGPRAEAAQLLYLPGLAPGCSGAIAAELLPCLLRSTLGFQRVSLAAEALCRSQLVLYNDGGSQTLQTLAQLLPNVPSLERKLGIYKLANQVLDGFVHLYRAHYQSIDSGFDQVRSLTALELATRVYLSEGAEQELLLNLKDQVAKLAESESVWAGAMPIEFCRYVPFDGICMAVEPTLKSIVTRVLLAEGDWFEREMELWRYLIEPGMVVMDVGANAGVYSFSAAKRVGPQGRVIAVEPFPGCVRCLQETRSINGFDWMTVRQAAASDEVGEAFLKLYGASELNELTLEEPEDGRSNVLKVARLTLDSLIELEGLERLDLLKIDAEGHEVEVIAGAGRLLERFSPLILYENLAGSQGSNVGMAEVLVQKGYCLARFEPWSFRLVPIGLDESLDGNLNVIAIPEVWADRLRLLIQVV
jgi:FkbM family methyltransferase